MDVLRLRCCGIGACGDYVANSPAFSPSSPALLVDMLRLRCWPSGCGLLEVLALCVVLAVSHHQRMNSLKSSANRAKIVFSVVLV